MNEDGLEQARRTARFFAGRRIDLVYASPLLRARQTAEVIAAPHGLPVQIVDDLIEVDVGAWEGRAWEEIENTDPEAYRRFAADAAVHPYLGGENLSTVLGRALPALEKLMAAGTGRTLVAVAHNVVNRSCLAHLLEMPLARYRLIPQDNCGVNLLRSRRGKIKVVTINAVEHLRDENGTCPTILAVTHPTNSTTG